VRAGHQPTLQSVYLVRIHCCGVGCLRYRYKREFLEACNPRNLLNLAGATPSSNRFRVIATRVPDRGDPTSSLRILDAASAGDMETNACPYKNLR
jgi:hypothetical protein